MRSALQPLPTWFPDNPPEGVTPLPPSAIVPQFSACLMEELPKFLERWIFYPERVDDSAPFGDEMVVMIPYTNDDDPTINKVQAVEKAVAARFVAILQASPVWNQLRVEVNAALTQAMTRADRSAEGVPHAS